MQKFHIFIVGFSVKRWYEVTHTSIIPPIFAMYIKPSTAIIDAHYITHHSFCDIQLVVCSYRKNILPNLHYVVSHMW